MNYLKTKKSILRTLKDQLFRKKWETNTSKIK